MKTSKTALAAAAFGVVAMVAPASAEEIRYNFTSEFNRDFVAAEGRVESIESKGRTFSFERKERTAKMRGWEYAEPEEEIYDEPWGYSWCPDCYSRRN